MSTAGKSSPSLAVPVAPPAPIYTLKQENMVELLVLLFKNQLLSSFHLKASLESGDRGQICEAALYPPTPPTPARFFQTTKQAKILSTDYKLFPTNFPRESYFKVR